MSAPKVVKLDKPWSKHFSKYFDQLRASIGAASGRVVKVDKVFSSHTHVCGRVQARTCAHRWVCIFTLSSMSSLTT